jgi:transposase
VRVGIEATGHTRWFERMLAEMGHELWIGDAAQIRAAMVRKQKTDAHPLALKPGDFSGFLGRKEIQLGL